MVRFTDRPNMTLLAKVYAFCNVNRFGGEGAASKPAQE